MKLSDKKIKNIIENNPLAFATIFKNKPYIIGISCCKVIDNKIVITDNFMGKTIENILKNNSVALVGWDKNLNGYQFLGKAKYFDSGSG